jgi:hypothetical protein
VRLRRGSGRISLRRTRRIAVMILGWHGGVLTQSSSQADLQERPPFSHVSAEKCDGSAAGGAGQCAFLPDIMFLPYIMKDALTCRRISRRRLSSVEQVRYETRRTMINPLCCQRQSNSVTKYVAASMVPGARGRATTVCTQCLSFTMMPAISAITSCLLASARCT